MSQSARTYNRYKDFTDDPSFKGHSKHHENVRKENTTEFEHSDSEDKNMTIQLMGVVFGSYLTTLIFCLKNYQLEDGTRQSMVGQIIGHFSGDQRYSWRQLFRKKAVKEKMAEYRLAREERLGVKSQLKPGEIWNPDNPYLDNPYQDKTMKAIRKELREGKMDHVAMARQANFPIKDYVPLRKTKSKFSKEDDIEETKS